MIATSPPLIAHVIHALGVGGLENGLVNLINRMPPERYRHAVVCLTTSDPAFAARIERPGVEVIALNKQAGKDPAVHARLWRTFRRLRPAIVHTRNLGALEAQLPAWLAGVPGRVHGEHGRDMADLDGSNARHRLLRRALRPLVQRYVPLSRDLEAYLGTRIGVPATRITRICNGVDTGRFRPDADGAARAALQAQTGWPPGATLIGWVGRMEPVKNPLALVDAFARLVAAGAGEAGDPRLVLVGTGSQQAEVERAVAAAGLGERVWLAGARDDVDALMRALDLFVLPSRAEGIANTILEALASGVPVVATAVGGNAELVAPGECGAIVPADDVEALAAAMSEALADADDRSRAAAAARRRGVERFSIEAMVTAYTGLYDRLLAEVGEPVPALARGTG